MTTQPRRRQAGFTLIELMIATSVSGVLASVAYPSGAMQKVRRTEALASMIQSQVLEPVMHNARQSARHGFTLVEVLVGLALALLVVAGAAALLASQIREHRALLLEARLMQDLRTAADLVARDLRRASHWGDAGAGVWTEAQSPRANPYTALAPDGAASDAASLRYSRDVVENHVVDSNEQFGFRLRNGAIDLQLGNGNWQALTDATVLTVTHFQITSVREVIELEAACPAPCPPGSETCPPRQTVRSLALQISAHAVADAAVTRTVQAQVRVRADALSGACPA